MPQKHGLPCVGWHGAASNHCLRLLPSAVDEQIGAGAAETDLLPGRLACRMTRKQMLQVWQVVAENTSYVAYQESQGKDDMTPKREPRFYPHTHYFECYESGGETPFHCPPDFNKSGALDGFNQPNFNAQLTDFALCAQNSSHSCTLRYGRRLTSAHRRACCAQHLHMYSVQQRCR